MMKLSVCIQKGKEVRKAIITVTKESNAEYIFARLLTRQIIIYKYEAI